MKHLCRSIGTNDDENHHPNPPLEKGGRGDFQKKIYIHSLIFCLSLLTLLGMNIIRSWASETKTEDTEEIKLDLIIHEVLRANPTLASFKRKVDALEERIDQAGSWDDPMVGITMMNIPIDSFSFSRENMTQKRLSLMQKIPFPGKIALKRRMAEEMAGMASKEYEDLRLRIIKEVKVSYYELAFVYMAIDITNKNKEILEELTKIAETKYAVGKGLQQDVLKAQVAMSRMIEDLIGLRQRKIGLIARLNILMDRSPDDTLGRPQDIREKNILYTFEDLKRLSLERSPVLKSIEREIEKNRYAVELARKEYYPDLGISIAYGQRNDSAVKDRVDFISGGISLSIPIWHKTKQDKRVSEMVYHLNMAEERYNSEKNKILFRIRDLIEKEKKTSRLIDLFKIGIIPQATQSLESALAGYRVNKVDFLTLLHNQITLFKYEVEYYRMIADHEIILADLESVVGARIGGDSK